MHEALKAASAWYVRLHEADASADDRREFERWQAASAGNRAAWARIRQVNAPFEGLEPAVGSAVLGGDARSARGRRRALKTLGALLVTGAGATLAVREGAWTTLLADHSTGRGEQRRWTAPDGSVLVLDTGSAIDLRFDANARSVHLLRGQLMVETGHGPGAAAPFVVHTRHGDVTALGTRFGVRDHGEHGAIDVFEHAVAVVARDGDGPARRIEAGRSVVVTAASVSETTPLAPGADLWVNGILSVNDMPLAQFLAELGRYHGGILRCDPAIAQVRVSGAFPVTELDAVLASLAATHGLQVRAFTRYWITLERA